MNADLIHETASEYARLKTGEAMERAVNAALPLSYAIAARFYGRGVEAEDLRQVAALALVSALKGFDPSRGLRFTTYVTPTITGTVRNHIRDKAQLLRTPRGLREQGIQMDRAYDELLGTLHREPSVKELADRLGWRVDRVLEIRMMREKAQVSSLDAPDDAGLMLFEKIGDTDSRFDAFEAREDLMAAMKKLSDFEKKLLALRFRDRLSQQAAAQRMNMTQMQVSRMERRLLKALREDMGAG